MKKMISIIFFVFIVSVPISIMATSLDVSASDGMLNAVIGADTSADGSQAHDEYRLVTTDATYKYDGTLSVSSSITITGVPDATTGRMPTIQPTVLADGSLAGTMLVMTGNNTVGRLSHLYLLAVATNNVANGGGVAVEVKGDTSNLHVDYCVFDGWQTFAIAYNGQWDSFFITNSHFRNMVHPNQHYIGEVLRNTWPGEAYTDSVVMRNNVMLAVNGYAAAPVTKWYQTYFDFSYNKVLYTFKNPFFIFNVTDAKINNNVFYGAYSGGVCGGENPWWDVLWNADPDGTFGVIALNPLSPDNAAMFDANYDANNPAATEALRKVEVKNNVYYWPTAVTDHWTSTSAAGTIMDIDTSSTPDGVPDSNLFVAPQWMDNQTTAMFNDDTAYPLMDMENNVNADPGFMTTLDTDILNGTSGADVGLLAWFDEIRGATATTNVWGYGYTQVTDASDYMPPWPLPEAGLSGGVLAVGDDLNETLPSQFVLHSNYPNPFNPTTKISYSISSASEVSLSIYNIRGELVNKLASGLHQPGTHSINWNGQNSFGEKVSTGIYIYSLSTPNGVLNKRLVLLK